MYSWKLMRRGLLWGFGLAVVILIKNDHLNALFSDLQTVTCLHG